MTGITQINFRRIVTAVMVLVSCASIPSWAASAAAQKQEQVATAMNDYLQHFNDYLDNPDSTRALIASGQDIAMPAILFPGGRNAVLVQERAPIEKGTQRFLDSYRAKGVSKLEWATFETHVLTDYAAIASTVANMLDEEGNMITKAASVYILRLNETGSGPLWQIVMRISHAPEDRISLD